MTASVTPLYRGLVLVPSREGPAVRVARSHKLVEQAATELHDGDKGSGVRALCFAATTHLALTIGADRAGDFFEMLARVAREVRPPEAPVVDCGDGLFLRNGVEVDTGAGGGAA